MKHWRTHTRPNGTPNIREHVWGWDAIGGWVAVIGLLVTILGFLISDRIAVEHRLSSIEMAAIQARRSADEAAGRASTLASAFSDHTTQCTVEHSDFLTRDEFYRHMAPEIRRPRGER